MTPLTLELHNIPTQRLDLSALTPDRLAGMSAAEISLIPLWMGNRQHTVEDFFSITGEDASQLVLNNAMNRLDCIGADMTSGNITINGDAGVYLGQNMRGGKIHVNGDVAEYAGSGMFGGHIRIEGNAGDFLAAAIPGERKGMRGGAIVVMGNAGDRVGDHLRRGTILIEGNTGDYCGSRMSAGTIIVFGKAGNYVGFGMKRGTILLSNAPDIMLPTFNDAGYHDLGFLVLLLSSLKELDSRYAMNPARKRVQRHLGDLACNGKGEILVWSDKTNMNCT